MEDALAAARYWCHACSQVVNPTMEMEMEMKCPFCLTGFVEEIGSNPTDLGADRSLSLWAPFLLGMMGSRRRRRRPRHQDFEDDDDNGHADHDNADRESIIRRRRRRSAIILQMLRSLRVGMVRSEWEADGDRDGAALLGNDNAHPPNQAIIFQGPYGSSQQQSQSQSSVGSFGDYFMGSHLDILLQHLAENDPNRFGTPPARKDALEAMPTVRVEESLQCPVCLDDFEIGGEATGMPCKHMYHAGCILPWLELHSSCPVCRFQIPAEESRRASGGVSEADGGGRRGGGLVDAEEGPGDQQRGNRRFFVTWLSSRFFSPRASQSGSGDSFSAASSSSSSQPDKDA